jgi:hypothetical protein
VPRSGAPFSEGVHRCGPVRKARDPVVRPGLLIVDDHAGFRVTARPTGAEHAVVVSVIASARAARSFPAQRTSVHDGAPYPGRWICRVDRRGHGTVPER